MKIRRVYNHWIPQLLNVDGITLYPFILFSGGPQYLKRQSWGRDLYKHEWIHVEQYRRDGVFKFAVKYLWYQITKGYEKNPYEVEAYRRQSEPFTPEEQSAWDGDIKS